MPHRTPGNSVKESRVEMDLPLATLFVNWAPMCVSNVIFDVVRHHRVGQHHFKGESVVEGNIDCPCVVLHNARDPRRLVDSRLNNNPSVGASRVLHCNRQCERITASLLSGEHI